MAVIDLQTAREQRTPHLQGPARCLACQHHWQAVSPQGVVVGFECPQCGSFQGAFEGICQPTTRFVCRCGCDIYFLLPDGCQCVRCGLTPRGL